MYRWAAVVLTVCLLAQAGCSRPPAAAGPEQKQPPSPDTTAGFAPPPLPGQLQAIPEGFRLQVSEGLLGEPTWVGASRLLVPWVPHPGVTQEIITYLVDLDSRQVRPELSAGMPYCSVPAGALQTVFALDPDLPQWAEAGQRRWDFPGAAVQTVTWVNAQAAVLTLTPQDNRNIRQWGKVLLLDLVARQVRVLAEQGQLEAVLTDGALLLRRGWVDGELLLLAPPYDQEPVRVAGAGTWTDAFAVSPEGGRLAWLELEPPPGDWSQRWPDRSERQPVTRTLAVWERASDRLQRYPLQSASTGGLRSSPATAGTVTCG